MPLYDYSCDKCSTVVELFLKSFQDHPNCSECGESMEYVPSFVYTSRAQGFTPVVIHRAADGALRFPGEANARVPKGFEKVELTTLAQVRQLEKEVNSRDQIKADGFRNTRSQFLDGQLSANREAMKSIVSKFTGRGRRFYEAMREASEKKQAAGRSHANPEFVVDAFTYNSSNREDYYNEYNESGSGRRGK